MIIVFLLLDWNTHEPNGGTAENCVQYIYPDMVWNDKDCNYANPAICEKPGNNRHLLSLNKTT